MWPARLVRSRRTGIPWPGEKARSGRGVDAKAWRPDLPCSPAASCTQIGLAHFGAFQKLAGASRKHDAAALQDIPAIRDAQRHAGILLDDQHRRAERPIDL